MRFEGVATEAPTHGGSSSRRYFLVLCVSVPLWLKVLKP